MKIKTIAVSFLIAVLCLGCDDSKKSGLGVKVQEEPSGSVYMFGTGVFSRVDVNGVDCVIGAGTFDHAAAVSCDWARKKDKKY